MFMKMLISLLE